MPRAIQTRQTVIMAIALAASVFASAPNAFAAVAGSSPTDFETAADAARKPEEFAFRDARPADRIAEAQRTSEARATAEGTTTQPNAGCALPSEPWGVPAALDSAITGPADKDRACMKALLIPDARITFVTVGSDGATSYKLLTLDDWIARTKARGRITLEEKQLNFRIDRFGNIAHLWSLYALRSDGQAVARGVNSIQAIKEAGGWRVTSIMVQAETAAAPLPEEYLP